MPGRSQRPIASRGKQGRRGKRTLSRKGPESPAESTEATLRALTPEQERYVRSVIGKRREAA